MKKLHQKNINRIEKTQVVQFLESIYSNVESLFPSMLYGDKYYFFIKSDSPGVSWIYFLKTKGEVPAKFCLFRS